MGALTIDARSELSVFTLDDRKVNAINPALLAELEAAIAEARARQHGIVLAGRPGHFSAGLDLKVLPALPELELHAALEAFTRVMIALYTHPRPVVAACTGHALAGGTVLLLTADERLGCEGPFRLGLTETQIGLPLPPFVVEMARSQLPVRSLHRVVTVGEAVDPAKALELGLVDRLVPAGELLPRAVERCEALSALPALAYRANKLVLRRAAEVAAKAGSFATPEFVEFMSLARR